MGRIVSNFFISLDGVVEAPEQWHFPYFDDQMGAAVERAMERSEGVLMGRRLYSEWSTFWPEQGDEGFAGIINSTPKYVVSSTLTGAEWNNSTVVPGAEAATRLAELKASTAGDLTMSGSATLARWLLANGLLDELNLLVHPIAVGHGQRLFEDTPTHPLTLVRSEVFGSGVLDLTYAPAS